MNPKYEQMGITLGNMHDRCNLMRILKTLKPCRICRGKAIINKNDWGAGYYYDIQCKQCRRSLTLMSNPLEAADEWNNDN